MADQKLSDARASAVYLEGPTDAPFAIAYGKYSRSPDINDKRHVYTSGDGVHALWYAGDAWYFGRLESVGKRMGFLVARENTDVPEDVAVPWLAATGDSWAAEEGISCITEETHIAAAKAALADAADIVYLKGATPGNVNSVCLGGYTKQSEILNGRHVYIQTPSDEKVAAQIGNLALWWLCGTWWVGFEKDVGSRRGLLRMDDDSALPESSALVGALWHVAAAEGGFLAAPDLKCSLTPGPPPAVVRALHAIQYVTMALTVAQVVTTDDDPKTLAGGVRVATSSLRKAFDMFDLDKNGRLDADELLAILTKQTSNGAGMSLDDAKELVRHFDKDENGALDFEVRQHSNTQQHSNSNTAATISLGCALSATPTGVCRGDLVDWDGADEARLM